MAATEFAANVRKEDGVAVIDLTGDVSGPAEQKLLEAYAQTGGEPVVLLDFSATDYINSTGIALIVGLLAQARAAGQEVQARGLAEHYREIFRITRLSDFMTILDDEGDET
jgi:anti-anti-sigma factor